VREAVDRLRRFIEAHGESRFTFCDEYADHSVGGRVTIDRAGFRRRTGEGWEYCVVPGAWTEIFAGLDRKEVNRILVGKGLVVPDGKGRPVRMSAFLASAGQHAAIAFRRA
jgi:putative DNA primase/helicase